MAEYALRLTSGLDTAARMRRGDALGLTPAGVGMARAGLRPDGGGVVAVVNGTMSVTVTPFAAWVDGGVSDAQAGYPFVLDAGVTLAIAAGHATLARVDTVVAQVRDNAFDGSGFTDARVYVVTGTPGAGAPAVPQSAVPLRDINVPAGASSGSGGLTSGNLGSDRRKYVAGLGGVLPVASSAERDALTTKVPGTAVYRTDTGIPEIYDGTTWQPVNMSKAVEDDGTVTVTVPGTTTATATVTFATPFATVPKVFVTPNSGAFNGVVTAKSTTGFTVTIRHIDGATPTTSVDVDWFARVK